MSEYSLLLNVNYCVTSKISNHHISMKIMSLCCLAMGVFIINNIHIRIYTNIVNSFYELCIDLLD